MEFESVLDSLERAPVELPDLDGLREIRKLLYSAEFRRQLSEYLDRHHNRREEAAVELRERLANAGAAFRDLIADRKTHQLAMRTFVIAGGTTISGGAILAVATATIFPPIGITVLAIGAIAAGKGYNEDRRLAAELSALHDIELEVTKFADRLGNKGI